jgi:hypothetical protein
MMMRTTLILLTSLMGLFFANLTEAGDVGVQVGFTNGEISTIRAYYRDHAAPAKPGNGMGRGGAKSLPPGIARNLQRGKALPPGIAKQVLPSGLVAELPPPPRGFERIEVAGRVLLVEIATQLIHDVIEDIVFGR